MFYTLSNKYEQLLSHCANIVILALRFTPPVLLADLDKDGSQDLITYLVTYVPSEKTADSPTSWSLVSQIRVIRLEHELPKLYEFLHKTGTSN